MKVKEIYSLVNGIIWNPEKGTWEFSEKEQKRRLGSQEESFRRNM